MEEIEMKWFSNLKIGTKLIFSFILVSLIAGIVGLIGINSMKTIDENDTKLYEKMTVPIAELAAIATAFQKIRIDTRDVILANSPEKIAEKVESIRAKRAEITRISSEFEKRILSKRLKDEYQTFLETRNVYTPYLEKIEQLAIENKDVQANVLLNSEEMTKAVVNEQTAIEKLIQMKNDDAKAQSDLNNRIADRATMTMIVFMILGILLAVGIGFCISYIISNPIKQLAAGAELIADGDLNVDFKIETRDEIGNLAASFKKMVNNLNEVMSGISIASQQVATGSTQISNSSLVLSQGSTEQASSIEELTSSLEELASQTRLNADSANEANQISEDVRKNALQGNQQMKEMLKAMDDMNDSSSNISRIIKVIDEIAFQTNILALNAAVEAARAGQHGKGFAVVAEEVRNLAARSANAAKETTEMIEGSIKKVESGAKIANRTADALTQIVEGVARVANLVNNIARASNEQATGIAQVNQAIFQVSSVVQVNSATAEESAAASKELANQAELLRQQLSRFKLKNLRNSFAYQGMEAMDSDVLKMIEQMMEKKKVVPYREVPLEAGSITKTIDLNDKEFGKY